MRRLINAHPDLFGGVARALSQRNYRLYAFGHVAHVHGWWGNRLGIGWLTWELTEQATWLGIITVAVMLPAMIVAPVAGAVADRYGHRRTAITGGLVGTAITGTLGVLALTGNVNLETLVFLTILQGSAFGLEFPARQALIPQLVGRKNISAAVAFNSTTFQLGTFLGPVLAAMLIATFNAGAAILAYTCSTAWMALMIRLIDIDPFRRPETGGGIIADMRAGFRYVAEEKTIGLLFLVTITSGFFLRPHIDLMPGFAADVFQQGAEGLGALTSASGLGALLVALWLLTRSKTEGLVNILVVSSLLATVALIVFAATPYFIPALFFLALAAGGLIANQVAAYSLVQTLSHANMRGRVISINISIGMGAPALGTLAIGWLADQVGFGGALPWAAVRSMAFIIFATRALRRRRHAMESGPDSE
ncbi:MAG: MFS transporter [Pseudomonadota bacterium]|nr:MFS transporter [Pseudomonadota bacterium]